MSITFLENGKTITRDIDKSRRFAGVAVMDEDATQVHTLDYAPWLGSATISAASVIDTWNISASIAGAGDSVRTLTISSAKCHGYADVKITATDGRIRVDRIATRERASSWRYRDYT